MTARKNLLDRVEITSPCAADWDEMPGTNQVRYCSECNKYVYNLGEMTRRGAEALVRSSDGRKCARMIRDLDGKTITVDSLPPVRLMSWRPGPIASAVVSAMITIVPCAAMSKDLRGSPMASYSADGAARKRTPPGEATASLAGSVFNENSIPMFGAVVTITSEASGDVLSQITSQSGEFRFDGLLARTYIVEIQAHDYKLVRKHDVNLQQGEVRRLDVSMERAAHVMGGIGIPVQPLRTLYLESDRVIVGEVGKSTLVKNDRNSRLVMTTLAVSYTIKGDGSKPRVNIYESVYGRGQGEFKEGEVVLAFLERRDGSESHKDPDGYQSVYGATSVKHLPSAALETYLQRLEELKALLANPDSKPEDTVEWLVRCAEDPATRREGAYELSMSALREVWEKEEARRRGAENDFSPRKPRDQEPLFSALLTTDQKQRLTEALLKAEELGDGDYDLIELVGHWNEPRLLPFLLSNLRAHVETAPESVEQIMIVVSEMVDDEEVSELLRHYRENARYHDIKSANEDAEVDEDADEDEDDTDAEASEAETSSEPEPTPELAKQARTAMLKKFIESAEAKAKRARTN